MGSIRDLRKLINRFRGGLTPRDVHTLERTTMRLQADLQRAFSIGGQGIPPKERVRRANTLCKAAHIILSVRNQQAISQTLNGTLDALEEAVERAEEQCEAFLDVHPGLKEEFREDPCLKRS